MSLWVGTEHQESTSFPGEPAWGRGDRHEQSGGYSARRSRRADSKDMSMVDARHVEAAPKSERRNIRPLVCGSVITLVFVAAVITMAMETVRVVRS